MNDHESSLRVTLEYLLITIILFAILYFGRALFIPLSYGLLVALVMYPVCKKLEQLRFPRSIAIAISLSIVIALFSLLLWLLVLQVEAFQQDLPRLRQRIGPSFDDFQIWIENRYGITTAEQDSWLQNQARQPGSLLSWLKGTVLATVNGLFILFLVPIFSALFLYNRSSFVHFLYLAAGKKFRSVLQGTLHEVVHTFFNYMKGMVFVYLIVGLLNSAGLFALGIRHALLFGFLTAIMTIIPYIGIVVSAMLPVSLAWIETGNIWTPAGVVAVFAIVQYLEANVIFPKVVGAQLGVNTWAMLVFILAGNILWGISGMILFIPLAGIIRITADRMGRGKALDVLLNRQGMSSRQAREKREKISSNV